MDDKDWYQKRFAENHRIEGFGFDVTMAMPCPFCAAADWMIFKILDSEKEMAKGAVCIECGRGAKAIFKHDQGGVHFEFVQTCGEDGPDWLPAMRRVGN